MSSSKRELSHFFAQELLPLSLFGKLDGDRKALLKAHLAECKECSAFADKLSRGQATIEKLLKLKAADSMVTALNIEQGKTVQAKIFQWQTWPAGMRWASELALGALAIVAVLEVIPWSKIVKHGEKSFGVGAAPIVETLEPGKPKDEELKITAAASPVFFGPSPGPSAESLAPANVANVGALPKKSSPPTSETKKTNTTKDETTGQGFLYRAEMSVDTPLQEPDPVKKVIESLGGQRAGEVHLGWKRETGRYYHFTIPENNYERLITQLRALGAVHTRRELHPRIMPEGVMRIILTVEEGSSSEAEPAAPTGENDEEGGGGAED